MSEESVVAQVEETNNKRKEDSEEGRDKEGNTKLRSQVVRTRGRGDQSKGENARKDRGKGEGPKPQKCLLQELPIFNLLL